MCTNHSWMQWNIYFKVCAQFIFHVFILFIVAGTAHYQKIGQRDLTQSNLSTTNTTDTKKKVELYYKN